MDTHKLRELAGIITESAAGSYVLLQISTERPLFKKKYASWSGGRFETLLERLVGAESVPTYIEFMQQIDETTWWGKPTPNSATVYMIMRV